MISKDELSWMFKQFLPIGNQENLWRPVRRICLMTLGIKGLLELVTLVELF